MRRQTCSLLAFSQWHYTTPLIDRLSKATAVYQRTSDCFLHLRISLQLQTTTSHLDLYLENLRIRFFPGSLPGGQLNG